MRAGNQGKQISTKTGIIFRSLFFYYSMTKFPPNQNDFMVS
ncbi:Hypothetical protein LUCI_4426 [Lucifera butyrica]|uniref:Uncharacterized protein n=1 Tax=Lucifera butyrica TaxID=1351585 RepID=A0A498RE94_9FIRM|nr:Hypothetical protein LUCI_4426 [Lucifera butyrica]